MPEISEEHGHPYGRNELRNFSLGDLSYLNYLTSTSAEWK